MNENNRIVYTQAFAIDIQRLRTNINKTTKIKPPLEVIIDSGTAESIVNKLTGDAYNSLSHIIGIGGAQISRRRGSFGNLKHCIEVPLTPAILLSAGRMLENDRWHHFTIEKDPLDSTRQRWIGVQHNGNKIVIGIRDKSTGLLFRATDEAGRKNVNEDITHCYFSKTLVVGSIFYLHRVKLNRLKVNYIVRTDSILMHVFG
jgi:hypothetical protein